MWNEKRNTYFDNDGNCLVFLDYGVNFPLVGSGVSGVV